MLKRLDGYPPRAERESREGGRRETDRALPFAQRVDGYPPQGGTGEVDSRKRN